LFQSDENERQGSQREEDYEKLFPKMGRDFIHIDDFNAWLNNLRVILTPLGITLPPMANAAATAKANQYKAAIESGEQVDYIDLVDIDKEEEE